MADTNASRRTVARFGPVTVEVAQGDITDQSDLDAIVNAANAQLLPGAGVAGAIHKAAGPELAAECRPLAPIRTGECVITSGQRLANRFVIHCLGPIYATDDDPPRHLASCYRRALELAEARELDSLCFPAISTGVFGYPIDEAANVAIASIAECAPMLTAVRRVRFVLFDDAAYSVFADTLRRVERQHTEGGDG